MSYRPTVLLVAPTPAVMTTMFSWLTDAGYVVRVAETFTTAKRSLEENPCLLVSEIRLGDYNGLHLALRAQARGVPAILLGEPDAVLEREAAQFGAIYLHPRVEASRLLESVTLVRQAAAQLPHAASTDALSGVAFLSATAHLTPVPVKRAITRRRPYLS